MLRKLSYHPKDLFDPQNPLFGAYLGLVVTILLAISGLILGVWQGSLTIQSDGIVSATDILTSFLFLSALRHSLRKADVIHNYGYGKYESLGILLNSLILCFALLYAADEIWSEIQNPTPIENYQPLVMYSLVSLLLLSAVATIQKKYAQKYRMPLLAYDADLWKVDAYAEVGVLGSLLLGNFLSSANMHVAAMWLDSFVAVVLLGFNLAIIVPHLRQSINQLLDRTLPESIQLDLLRTVVEHIHEICEFRDLHTRQSGRDLFIEIDVVLPFDMTIEEGYRIEREIQKDIRLQYPTAIVRLYAVPCPRDCIHEGKRFCPVLLQQKHLSALKS